MSEQPAPDGTPSANRFKFEQHLRTQGRVLMETLQRKQASDISQRYPDDAPRTITLTHKDGRRVTINAPWREVFNGIESICGLDDVRVYTRQGFVLPENFSTRLMPTHDRIQQLEGELRDLKALILERVIGVESR